MKRIFETFDLYEAAFYIFLRGKLRENYGVPRNEKFVIETNIFALILGRMFGWVWKGLRDARVEVKFKAYGGQAKMAVRRMELGIDKPTKKVVRKVKREQMFLANIDKIKSRELSN